MKIELKLFATLREKLPPGSKGGRAVLEVEDGLTIEGLLKQLEIAPELAQLVLVNGVSEGDSQRKLEDGDTVSIFPPVAGG